MAPPQLGTQLEDYYPERALTEKIEGYALLRIKVHADGHVRVLRTIEASHEMFELACGDMLLGSTWTPALDSAHKPMDFEVSYRCDFGRTKFCWFCARNEAPQDEL